MRAMTIVISLGETGQGEDHLGASSVVLMGGTDTGVDDIDVDAFTSRIIEVVGKVQSTDVRVGG